MDTLKKLMEEDIECYFLLRSKTRDLISSITKNENDYDEKYIKIKFNSDEELPLNKTVEFSSMINAVRTVFMKMTDTIRKFF